MSKTNSAGNKQSRTLPGENKLGFGKGTSLAFLNIRELQKHIDELRSFISERGIHIMAINETKLSKYSPDCLVSINDFAVEWKDRNEDGGGVAIYIRNMINYKLVEN